MIDVSRLIKILKTLTIIVGVFLLISVGVYFGFRQLLLKKALDKAQAKMHTKFGLNLQVKSAAFSGIADIQISGLSLLPATGDTIFHLNEFHTGARILPLFTGSIALSHLTLQDGFLQWVKTDSTNNFDFLNHLKNEYEQTQTDDKPTTANGYAKNVFRFIDRIFDAAPSQISIHNIHLKIEEPDGNMDVVLNECMLQNEKVNATVLVQKPEGNETWLVGGMLNLSDKTTDIQISGSPANSLPYIDRKFNVSTGFEKASLQIKRIEMDNAELHIEGNMAMSNFKLNHPKVASKDVLLPKAAFDFHQVIGKDFIMLDSASVFRIEGLNIYPFAKLETATDTILQLSIIIPRIPAQHFVNALPEGLFNHIRGMEVKGEFDYRMDFVYNENKPKDLIFESKLNKYNLTITRYGIADLAKLNGEFVHTPYERGVPVRPIVVGAANPYYTPLDQVSPFLKTCVLTTEDPSFFYHRGFIDEAFRQSIIKNIRTRKFARGASTISMQLVKNVFLSREKTLSRKLEEILLVYIIENNRISTKERMLEVYFNIIEWGPNVYGIGEAAAFYFNKHPSQLNLSECLFLATIIPRPKGFMWRFDKQGLQKEFVGRQYKFLSEIMVRRNVLNAEDTIGINYRIPITGRAKDFIKIAPDTNQIQEELIIGDDGRVKQSEYDE